MSDLVITVSGKPAPQGSKKAFGRIVRGEVVISMVEASERLKPWRKHVAAEARQAADEIDWRTLDGPVEVRLKFGLPRPQSHLGTGRNRWRLKPSAPRFPTVKNGDLDKLVRAVLDALTTAKVYKDDAQVVRIKASKDYSEHPGVLIHVRSKE